MMLLAMSAATMPAPTEAAAPPTEIVVVGERMRRLRVVTRQDRRTGTTRCIVRGSSGDAALDAAVCAATLACAQTETREKGMIDCLNPHMAAIVRRFAKRGTGPEE